MFGIEFAVRGLRAKPFPPRAKYALAIYLVVVCMLLLVNFLVADFVRAPDFCFASLFWFVAIYSRGCFAALLAIDIILVLCAVMIFVQLTRTTTIEASERVSASRMIYYLALAIVSIVSRPGHLFNNQALTKQTLIIPFFFSLGFRPSTRDQDNWNSAITLSMVASVVANVSGLMTGGLHLFLRSNNISAIGPRHKAGEYERRRIKGSIRRYGSSEPDFAGHMMGPVGSGTDLRRMLSDASLISGTVQEVKEEEAGVMSSRSPATATYVIAQQPPNPLRSNAFLPRLNTADAAAAASVRTPEPAQMSASEVVPESAVSSAPSAASTRNTASSPENTKSLLLLPATTYAPGSIKTFMAGSNGRFDLSSLKPPPSMNNLTTGRHRRDSSMVSSATVQIGLRLSNANDFNPMDSQILDKMVYSLDMTRNGSTSSIAAIPPAPGPAQAPPQQTEQKQEQQPPQEEEEEEPVLLAPTIFGQQRPSSSSSPSPPPFIPLPVLPPPQQDSLSPARRPSPLSNTGHLSVSSSGSEELPVAFFEDESPHRDPVKDARMKTLPPVPRPLVYQAREYIPENEDVFGDNAQLSPSVYSSQPSPTASAAAMAIKLPSPRGVGFATVSRSNSSAALRTIAASNSGLARSSSAASVMTAPRTRSPVNITSAPRSSGGNDMPDKASSDWI